MWNGVVSRGAVLTIAGALALSIGAAFATYPERPMTIVVPFPPGGANDIVVRIIQQPLGERSASRS